MESATRNNSDHGYLKAADFLFLLLLRLRVFARTNARLLRREAVDRYERLPKFVRAVALIVFVVCQFFAAFVVLRTVLIGEAIDWNGTGVADKGLDNVEPARQVRRKSAIDPEELPIAASSVALLRRSDVDSDKGSGRALGDVGEDRNNSFRILYVVTALAEFNDGSRSTIAGQDRLQGILLPVLTNGVETMISDPYNYDVDVYLILGYALKQERRQMIQDTLPDGVGLEVWDDALPIGYDRRKEGGVKLVPNTRALARQHRYVVKDKLRDYDFFVVFEDDMLVTGEHVHHFVELSTELERLRNEAPAEVNDGMGPEIQDPKQMKFYGQMSELQMSRLMPGFIRVEVLLDEERFGSQKTLDPIPVDRNFPVKGKLGEYEERYVDPRTCCHIPNREPRGSLPPNPPSDKLVIWETGIKGLSVRQMPGSSILDWVVLMPGPGKRLNKEAFVGGYWSGRDGAFGDEAKPGAGRADLIAQQAGWMASRQQLIRIHDEKCMGGFFPPFDEPDFKDDGQASNNVEFWSGGYQFFTGVKGGCNIQRVISLDPDHFSKHLIYHTANNKQRTISRERFVKANSLLGQLNSVRKAAEKAKRYGAGLGFNPLPSKSTGT